MIWPLLFRRTRSCLLVSRFQLQFSYKPQQRWVYAEGQLEFQGATDRRSCSLHRRMPLLTSLLLRCIPIQTEIVNYNFFFIKKTDLKSLLIRFRRVRYREVFIDNWNTYGSTPQNVSYEPKQKLLYSVEEFLSSVCYFHRLIHNILF